MWIIPKNYKLSAFAPDTVESKEDLSLLERSLTSSLMWRSKPSPLPTWSRRWKRESWVRHLFGRTLKPCLDMYFETRLMSSLEGIRASRLAQQESDREQTTPATCGLTSAESSTRLDQGAASLKTSKDTSASDSEKSSQTWKQEVIQRRGEYSARQKLEHRTKEKESLSWPTPTTQDSNKATKKMREGHQNNLTALVFHKEMFPTPTARDYKGGYNEASLMRKDGKSRRFDALPNAAIGGVGTDVVPGHLNPDWVEWLMGVPTGWTDFDFSETE